MLRMLADSKRKPFYFCRLRSFFMIFPIFCLELGAVFKMNHDIDMQFSVSITTKKTTKFDSSYDSKWDDSK